MFSSHTTLAVLVLLLAVHVALGTNRALNFGCEENHYRPEAGGECVRCSDYATRLGRLPLLDSGSGMKNDPIIARAKHLKPEFSDPEASDGLLFHAAAPDYSGASLIQGSHLLNTLRHSWQTTFANTVSRMAHISQYHSHAYIVPTSYCHLDGGLYEGYGKALDARRQLLLCPSSLRSFGTLASLILDGGREFFVKTLGRRLVDGLWNLISHPTVASFLPSFVDFEAEHWISVSYRVSQTTPWPPTTLPVPSLESLLKVEWTRYVNADAKRLANRFIALNNNEEELHDCCGPAGTTKTVTTLAAKLHALLYVLILGDPISENVRVALRAKDDNSPAKFLYTLSVFPQEWLDLFASLRLLSALPQLQSVREFLSSFESDNNNNNDCPSSPLIAWPTGIKVFFESLDLVSFLDIALKLIAPTRFPNVNCKTAKRTVLYDGKQTLKDGWTAAAVENLAAREGLRFVGWKPSYLTKGPLFGDEKMLSLSLSSFLVRLDQT